MSKTEGILRIGPAGWAYDDWKGTVYPADMPRSLHPLTFLCERFDTVEINVSFYRPITANMSKSWIEKTAGNPNFVFAAKLWERYTHQRSAFPSDHETATFKAGLEPLHAADKLGALLAQFPWSFRRTTDNRKHLARIIETYTEYPIALELRHDSWLNDAVYDGLRKRNVAFCNIDQPIFDRSIAPTEIVTADIAYVRLHGRNREAWFREDATRDERYDYKYSTDELQPWVDKIRHMRERAKQVYVVTNNHFRGQAVENAIELQQMLAKEPRTM